MPSAKDFKEVREENELLAWVLLFGNKINHFGIGVYLRNDINNLEEFNRLIETDLKIPLNTSGSKIKGDQNIGIAQSATMGQNYTIKLRGGDVTHPGNFMEFIWRYSKKDAPVLWEDYYTYFVPQNANHIVKSATRNVSVMNNNRQAI